MDVEKIIFRQGRFYRDRGVFLTRFKSKGVWMLNLSDYSIDAKNGFLGKAPIRRLSSEYFSAWETVLDDLSHSLLAWKLRDVVSTVMNEICLT